MFVTITGLVIVVASAIYVAWPLLAGMAADETTAEHSDATARSREKEAALEAIREIDFDHRVGKISDADHAALRSDLEKRALQALSALDEAEAAEPELQAIAGGASAKSSDDPGGFCAACGKRFQKASRFCVSCGKKLPKSGGGRGRRRANS